MSAASISKVERDSIASGLSNVVAQLREDELAEYRIELQKNLETTSKLHDKLKTDIKADFGVWASTWIAVTLAWIAYGSETNSTNLATALTSLVPFLAALISFIDTVRDLNAARAQYNQALDRRQSVLDRYYPTVSVLVDDYLKIKAAQSGDSKSSSSSSLGGSSNAGAQIPVPVPSAAHAALVSLAPERSVDRSLPYRLVTNNHKYLYVDDKFTKVQIDPRPGRLPWRFLEVDPVLYPNRFMIFITDPVKGRLYLTCKPDPANAGKRQLRLEVGSKDDSQHWLVQSCAADPKMRFIASVIVDGAVPPQNYCLSSDAAEMDDLPHVAGAARSNDSRWEIAMFD